MTGKTHRVGGMLGGLVGFSILKSKGLLAEDIAEPLQLVFIYASSMYGSTLSDMDKNWSSCPSKDVFSWVVYRILHLTTPIRKWLLSGGKLKKKVYELTKGLLDFFDAKHRSWQTHSDLTMIGIIYLLIILPSISIGSWLDRVLLTIVGEGVLFGVLSHLFLDMITTDGIWSFILAPLRWLVGKGEGKKNGTKDYLFRLRLVPDKKFFSTDSSDSPWERVCRFLMYVTIVVVFIRIIYLWSPYRIVFGK